MTEAVQQLSVVIHDNIPFKHWALLLTVEYDDGVKKYYIYQVSGGGDSGRFYYAPKTKNSEHSIDFENKINVGQLLHSNIREFNRMAKSFNQDGKRGWNCQSYVIDLLVRLRQRGSAKISKDALRKLRDRTDGLYVHEDTQDPAGYEYNVKEEGSDSGDKEDPRFPEGYDAGDTDQSGDDEDEDEDEEEEEEPA
jgi:hypothetical protein